MLLDTVLAQGQRRNRRKWAAHHAGKLTTPTTVRRVFSRVATLLFQRILGDQSQVHPDKPRTNIDDDVAAKQITAFRRAASRRQPDRKAIDFRVVLFRAADRSRWTPYVDLLDDYGWGQYLGEGFCVVDVPGSHRSIIEPPNVDELGCTVQALLGDPAPET